MANNVRELLKNVTPFWRAYVLVLTPIFSSILPITSQSQESKCAYVLINMAVYWVTEALPLAVTSLIPVFAFPILGILSTGDVSVQYMKSTNMLFIGGLMVATAVEESNLHKRIALFVILHVGQSPRRLMAGFMMTTMFLSMWISNTASTAMMIPIVDAIVEELFSAESQHGLPMDAVNSSTISSEEDLSVAPHRQSKVDLCPEDRVAGVEAVSFNHGSPEEPKETDTNKQKREMRNMCFLGVAYSANVGGTGSLTGTGPNLVFKGLLDSTFEEPTGMTFTTWMAFNVPGMIICVLLEWIWLQIYFLGIRKKNRITTSREREKGLKKLIKTKYEELGDISFKEGSVLCLFILLVLLWLFRDPGFMKGWAYLFKLQYGENYVKIGDATSAIFVAILLFALPAKLNFWPFSKSNDPDRNKSSESIISWGVVHEKVPWGLVILVGAGYAMAEASKTSGLSEWMGNQLRVLDFMPLPAMALVISLMIAMTTEVTSNTAIASILLPVLLELSLGIGVNPLYLMLTAAVCCSYAFMLPVATPPNAIAFGAANMSTSEMMKVGFIMNIACVLVLNVMINTLGVAMFDLYSTPSWINSTIAKEDALEQGCKL